MAARTILVYGVSDTYKTTQIGEFADWVYALTGGITRLVSADSGWRPIEPQIKRGIIHPWNLTTTTYPLACMVKVSQGWWPDQIDEEGNANEKTLRLTRPDEWKATDGYPGIGAYAFEGLTMIAEHLMSDLTNKQRQTGEPLIGLFEELGVKFASSSRGSYQFVQKVTREYVSRLKGLGCAYVLVSSHEGKGEDDAKRPIYGPAVVGKASSEKVPSWFGTTVHHEKYMYRMKLTGGKEVIRPAVRAFFTTHQDPEIPTKFWPAKTDVAPRVQARLLDVYPEGYYPVTMDANGNYTSGLHTFLELIRVSELEGIEPLDTPQDEPISQEEFMRQEAQELLTVETSSVVEAVADSASQESAQPTEQQPVETPLPAVEIPATKTKTTKTKRT